MAVSEYATSADLDPISAAGRNRKGNRPPRYGTQIFLRRARRRVAGAAAVDVVHVAADQDRHRQEGVLQRAQGNSL